jgi:hypothetical protein
VRPDKWIDLREFCAAEAEVDACGTGFERRGRIVESRSADAENANPLSREPIEIYVVSRMGITLGWEIGDEGRRCPPASTAVKPGCEDDLSRMHAFDAAFPAQTSEEEVAGGLDRCYFDVVFHRQFENIAVPIEIVSPYLWGKLLNALPCSAAKSRLVPGTGGETRDAEVDAAHLLAGPQRLHAGKSAPRPL